MIRSLGIVLTNVKHSLLIMHILLQVHCDVYPLYFAVSKIEYRYQC